MPQHCRCLRRPKGLSWPGFHCGWCSCLANFSEVLNDRSMSQIVIIYPWMEGNCSYDAALCVGVSLEGNNYEDLFNTYGPRHARKSTSFCLFECVNVEGICKIGKLHQCSGLLKTVWPITKNPDDFPCCQLLQRFRLVHFDHICFIGTWIFVFSNVVLGLPVAGKESGLSEHRNIMNYHEISWYTTVTWFKTNGKGEYTEIFHLDNPASWANLKSFHIEILPYCIFITPKKTPEGI